MPKFGQRSLERLSTCCPELRMIMHDAIEVVDFTIIQGHRTEEEHAKYLQQGTTTIPYERSKHSLNPSDAVDIAPWPIDWEDTGRFQYLAGVVMAFAKDRGVKIQWGGHWETFVDMPHFEIIRDV